MAEDTYLTSHISHVIKNVGLRSLCENFKCLYAPLASYLWFYKVFKGFIKTKYLFRSSSFGIKYAYIWKKIVFIITKCIRILDMQHLCLIDIDLISNPKCFELQLDLIVRQYYGHFVCKLFLNLVCIITLFQVGQ